MTREELLKLLPVWYQRIKEYPEIMKAYASAFSQLKVHLANVSNNLYLTTCDEPTLADWERLMKIYPAPGEDLDTRRNNVIARWGMVGEYNAGYYREQFNLFFGKDSYVFYKFSCSIPLPGDSYMILEFKTYIPNGRKLAYEIWLLTAPVHVELKVYDRYDTEINSKMYFGGACSQTTIITI